MKVLGEIKKKLELEADISEIYYEGPEVIAYTKEPDKLTEIQIRSLVKEFKRRIEIRPDSSILLEPEESEKIIRGSTPAEANITDVSFVPEFNKVIIEAEKPGLVIGKAGQTLAEIKSRIRWIPEIVRKPIIPSHIIRTIRETLKKESKDRRSFLKRVGVRIHERRSKSTDWIRVCPLGGFREVGRSSVLVQSNESNILLDCGVNVATEGKDAYPYLGALGFDLKQLDAVIISHAHLDHAGFLPYLYKFGYDGPTYTTAPTRDLMTLLQLDFVDIAQREGKNVPYSKEDIKNTIKHTVTPMWGEVTDITPDTRLTLYNAGHILGSSVTHLHVGDGMHNIVYTGDFKFGPTSLLERAHTDFMRVETMLIESTYGNSRDIQPNRRETEGMLVDIVKKTLENKGKVLIPVLGVGRAQELLVILDNLAKAEHMDGLKVYIDGMIWDATAIHTAYPEFLSRRVRNLIFREDYNPFLSDIFVKVHNADERRAVIESAEPCVILATSGMLTGGPSVEYLRGICGEERNSLIFVSYQAEGTLGKRIQKGWTNVTVSGFQGKLEEVNVGMNVFTVEGFSGHSDRRQLVAYVMNSRPVPERVIIGHGEESKSMDLANALRRAGKITAIVPRNLDAIRLA